MPPKMPRQRSAMDDSESNMPDQVTSAVEYGMEQTKKLCKEILPLCSPEQRKDLEKSLTERFKKLIRAQLVYEESSRIVSEVADELESGDSARDILGLCDLIQTESQRRIEQFQSGISDATVTRNPAFQAFKKELTALVAEQETDTDGDSDSDEQPATKARGKKRGGKSAFDPQPDEVDTEEEDNEEASEEEGIVNEIESNLCPLTKKQITDPVRNKHCEHIYSKQSILQYMKGKKVKCPYAVCSNTKYLYPSHLIENDELTENFNKKGRGKKRGKK